MPKIIKNGVTYIGTSDNAAAVSYDNTSSGLAATNVQGAIDEIRQVMIDAIYPVGSIYMSVSSTNPGTTFGVGTWEAWGSGRVPVGVDSSDTAFDTVEETGGNKNNSYTPAGTIEGTKLTAAQSGVPAHSHGLNSHTHSVGAHKHGLNSHTHSVGAHKHGLNSHTHTIPALSGTAANKSLEGIVDFAPNITLNGPDADIIYNVSGAFSSTKTARQQAYVAGSVSPSTTTRRHNISLDVSHKHTVTTVANTTGAASGSTENSSAFNTGAASGSTENSSAFNTGAASGSTANNSAAAASETHTHSWTGTAANISTVQPYITCYMWKRTA